MKKRLKGILLVDDDFITNHLNSELIREMNIASNVVVCYSGEDAIDYLRKYHGVETGEKSIDMIFLDINMPGMDGFEFLEMLEKMKILKDVDVVLVTTSDNQRDLRKAEQFKIKGYLNKPLTEEKIDSVINLLAS